LLIISFMLICFMPLHCFYLRARKAIGMTLMHILIAPFGHVRFRHFFLADVMTSMTTPIQMTATIYCFFLSDQKNWKSGDKVDLKEECAAANIAAISLGFIPYWFRFMQCLRKYYDSNQKVHLINAGKYFSDLCVPFAGLWYVSQVYDKAFYIWLGIHTWATTYSYIWDIYMDWGLFRWFEPGPNMCLREKISYSPIFYYWAIVTDLLLRFSFVIGIWQYGASDSYFNQA